MLMRQKQLVGLYKLHVGAVVDVIAVKQRCY